MICAFITRPRILLDARAPLEVLSSVISPGFLSGSRRRPLAEGRLKKWDFFESRGNLSKIAQEAAHSALNPARTDEQGPMPPRQEPMR